MKLFRQIGLIVLVLSISLVALPAEEEIPKVKCHLLCFGLSPLNPVRELSAGPEEGERVECNLPIQTISEGYELPAPGGIVQFRINDQPSAPIAAVKIPASMREAILIFLPVAKGEAPKLYDVIAYDYSKKTFPANGSLVINLSDHDLRFIIGKSKIQLPPGEHKAVPRPGERNDFNMAGVFFQLNGNEGWTDLKNTSIHFPEGKQYLFISYYDALRERVNIRTFPIVR